MHRARRAILIAAGTGIRLRPITSHTPKPLIRVSGAPILESQIERLNESGIRDICVVVGYMREAFEYLTVKYPGLKLIYNPDYMTCNNISSIYAARELLDECLISEADLLLSDASPYFPEFERSCYCAIDHTARHEWMLTTERGVITDVDTDGNGHGRQLYGISLWTREDALRLRHYVEYEFEKRQNRGIYWDEVALLLHREEFRLGVRMLPQGTIREIDSLDELIRIEPSYRALNLTHEC